jgi:hypothetical protein
VYLISCICIYSCICENRSLCVASGSGRSEIQLKLLQILLQLANCLSKNATTEQYLTEQIVCAFLSVSFSLSDSRWVGAISIYRLSAS